jgi:hypothetical protein
MFKSYLKVQEVTKGSRGTPRSKRYLKRSKMYLKVQEVPTCPRGTLISKRYIKDQEVHKGPRCTLIVRRRRKICFCFTFERLKKRLSTLLAVAEATLENGI